MGYFYSSRPKPSTKEAQLAMGSMGPTWACGTVDPAKNPTEGALSLMPIRPQNQKPQALAGEGLNLSSSSWFRLLAVLVLFCLLFIYIYIVMCFMLFVLKKQRKEKEQEKEKACVQVSISGKAANTRLLQSRAACPPPTRPGPSASCAS